MSLSAYERLKLARSSDRPTGKDYVAGVFTGFIELHGDLSLIHI